MTDKNTPTAVTSDGSTASYYELPEGARELQDLISHRNMNAQIGEIFRACYRYGLASHSDQLRDAKKIRFYAEAEIRRLEKLAAAPKVIDHDDSIWIRHDGRPLQAAVKDERSVEVRFLTGRTHVGSVGQFYWAWGPHQTGNDIVEYRLL